MLVYFAVSKLGEKPIDGKTDVNPEGLTAAYGKHATAMAERLAAGDLSCKVRQSSSAAPSADRLELQVSYDLASLWRPCSANTQLSEILHAGAGPRSV